MAPKGYAWPAFCQSFYEVTECTIHEPPGSNSLPQPLLLRKQTAMPQDIRKIAHIDHKDVVGLNFIRSDGKYIFRRHFRQGLRSHILEILDPADIEAERYGAMFDGVLHFPKAQPKKMLRIFRTRLSCLDEALAEIQRVKMAERFLTPEFVAQSTEIIVEYHGPETSAPLLCGVQEYVIGVILDPWSVLDSATLLSVLYDSLAAQVSRFSISRDRWLSAVRKYGSRFIEQTRKMILQGRHIPDLAGVGNILITPSGKLKLVDINNISEIFLDDAIRLDDRNYPVCDKSVEALALIEEKLLDRTIELSDPIYGIFLTPERKRKLEKFVF